MKLCNKYINNGMILRCIVTIFVIHLIRDVKHLYLILPIVLTILDLGDNLWTIFYKKNNCVHTLNYQVKDKIVDTVSYIGAYYFLGLNNPLLLFFIIARTIGSILYTFTGNPFYIVIFADFVKEYMLYIYFIGNDKTYLLPCIILKMMFEYKQHIKRRLIKDDSC